MRHRLTSKRMQLKRKSGILFLGLCIFLTACKSEEKAVQNEVEGSIVDEEEYVQDETGNNADKYIDTYPYIDYDFIEKYHKILNHNICTSPKNDYYNTVLEEYLRENVESDKKIIDQPGEGFPLTIDYFPFDFNADGLEDYLVCYHGSLWCGSGGNTVMIYTQEESRSLRKILDITVRLDEPDLPDGHAPIAVLDEKTDGYYAIVLPGSNRILRYDKERDWYEFETEMGNCQYTCEKVTDGYEVTLYDKTNKKVYSEIYPKEPWIKEITEDILEIGISTGSPCSYVFYFQKSDAKISETYYNPILIKNKYIAYMEENRELILTDMFNEGLFYEKIVRNFTETADPISAVINIEMPDDESILLEYYKGADYGEEAEIIAINKAIAKD